MLAVIGAGLAAGAGHAQVPGLPGPPGGGGGSQPPPPPPVADPGPLGDATTHAHADAARRGAIASGGLQPPLRPLWRHDFDALISEAVAGDGRAYVFSGTRVTAIELRTGRIMWTSAAQLRGGLAYARGKLIALGDRGLVALDAATGAVAWTADADESYVSGDPLIAGDAVILQYQGLTAFDLDSGARRWKGGDDDGVDGAPAAAGDRIFQIGGCTVAAVDRRNGNAIWRRNSGCSGGSSGSVALHGERVHSTFGDVPLAASDGSDVPGPNADIIAGDIGLQRESGGLAAVSLTGGQLLWRTPVSDDSVSSDDALGSPLVVGDAVYRTRFAGTLEARALATGAVTFSGRLREAKSTFTGSTSAYNSTIAGGEGVLVVLRGSTVDGLATATEPLRSVTIEVPPLAKRQIEAGTAHVVTGGVTGDLVPTAIALEADPYPFDRFEPVGRPRQLPTEESHPVVPPDRNVRVRYAGVDGNAAPSEAYTVFAYPRIRFVVRNVRNLVTARLRVTGSRAIRFRGRRAYLYIYRGRTRRLTRLGSTRLVGAPLRTGRGVVRFRALKRVGRRDYLFACVPRVHRLGQGAPDPVQRRCGRRRIKI